MKQLISFLVSGSWFLSAPTAPAIVDTNENGLSDLWEQANNNGDLFPTTYDPQADPDRDGWNNAQEAAAGTDPNNSSPPDGLLRPDITHVPAVMGEENGQPVVITPEAVVISWVTTPGKQYTLLYSPDLSPNSWLPVGEPFIGTGFIREFGFPNADADRLFLRVATSDADTDNDGLTDAEEHTLGTNSLLADSDGDGSNDFDEIANATLPRIRDTDEDGVLDGDEASTGTDPLLAEDLDADNMPDDWEKFMSTSLLEIFPDPAHWGARHSHLINQDLEPSQSYTSDGLPAVDVCVVMVNTEDAGNGEGIQFEWQEKEENFSGSYEPEREMPYSGHGASSSPEWSRLFVASTYSEASSLSLAGLVSRHSALAWAPVSVRDGTSGDYTRLFNAFPCEPYPPEYISTSGLHAHSNYYTFSGADTSYGMIGRKKSFRVRLASRKPVSEITTANWLRIKYTGFFNSAIDSNLINEIEGEAPEISKGGMFSDWVTVDAEFPAGSQGPGDENNVALIPVEVEQAGSVAGDGIRFCRWLDSFTGNSLDEDCADKDRDRFRIRIPTFLPNVTKIHIKVTGLDGAIINGAWEAKTTDGDYDVSLTEENGALVSTWMLLVSDGDDDLNYNGIGADDGANDQTILADFGAKIEVTLPELGNFKTVFFPQKPRGTVTVDAFYLSPAGDVPLVIEGAIGRHIGKMKEIYRQIGVRVAWAGIEGMAVSQAWFDAKPDSNEVADYFTPSESDAARAAVRARTVPEKHIRVGYVDATVMQNGLNPWDPNVRVRGFTILGTDGIIVSLDQNDARSILGVTAHEVGHTLGLPHTKLPTWNRWLLKGNGIIWNDDHLDSKRFQLGDHDIIRKKTDFYVPN